MWPEDLERVQTYNRMEHSNYVSWLLNKVNMPMRPVYLALRTREDVDLAILIAIEENPVLETPSWIEAAHEALSPIEEPEVIEELEVGDLQSEDVDSDSPFNIQTDYDAMTVVELRDLCKDRGLTIRGTKAEVVLRLRRDDEGLTQDIVELNEDETEAPSEEAAEELLDAPAEEAAVTEEVTNNANSGETSDIEEEE